GNVFLPASLLFVPAHPQTPATTAAVELLTADPELTPAALAAALQAKHLEPTDVAAAGAIYYDLRREAVRDRVEQLLPTDSAPDSPPSRSTTPTAAKIPTASGSVAGAASTTAAGLPVSAADAEAVTLRRALFPHQDPTVPSPEGRLVDEARNWVRADRLLLRLGRPPAGDVSAYVARNQIVPAAPLIGAAAASGFVDYSTAGDGTVRTVPLLMAHGGRLFAQMGLRVACQLLEVDPADLKVTPSAVTIPAGTLRDGTPRPERTIPVRTIAKTVSSGRTIEYPLVMDIPWFGGRQWYTMYDGPAGRTRAQHLPIGHVYGAVRTRQKMARAAAEADRAARNLLSIAGAFAPEVADGAAAYERRTIAGADPAADAATAAWVLKQVEPAGFVPGSPTDGPAVSEKERIAIRSADALAAVVAEAGKLPAQLAEQRAELRAALAGKAAIVGWTATSAVADQKPTPLHSAAPGVVILGVVANAILTGDVWRTAPDPVTWAVAVGLGLLTTVAVARLSPVAGTAAALGLLCGYGLLNAFVLFDYGNLIVGLATPLLAVAAPWAGGTLARLLIETKERQRITLRLGSWVDKDLVDYVLESKDETIFSGQRRETTVVFTDLEGFTRLSDELKEAIVPVLNDFMGRATTVIKAHRGFVNKFLGDGIMYFFNAPRPNVAFVPDAVASVLALRDMMAVFNADLQTRKLPQLKLRAGVTTGNVIAGDAGSKEHADYTVLGDYVNLAARLESANKYFGTANLVTAETKAKAGDGFLFRPVGVIQVVGLSAGVMTYEVLAWAKAATAEQTALAAATAAVVDAFTAGLAADCLAAVGRLEAAHGPSKLAKVYRELSEPYAGTAEGGGGESGGVAGGMPRQIVLDAK
ncbi:MAG: hypothetical protein JWO31_3528, partial [Phycisphaerales bacterium]|nr:hypothetical protein [Phycisphaerales bacterium]